MACSLGVHSIPPGTVFSGGARGAPGHEMQCGSTGEESGSQPAE